MCGIAGVAGFPLDEASVLSQVGLLRHRGPDSYGVHWGTGGAVGQSRLAIIDLVTGDPPIANEDGAVGVALNGEIYNFRELQHELRQGRHDLKTDGDTEVIAHLAEDLEPEALCRRLDGMFAFAVWDERRRRLVLRRDRLGKKPLYYWQGVGGDLVFGSEIKAVLADPRVPRRLMPQAIDAYLALGYVPTPLTFFEGVRSVPPGHVVVALAGQQAEVRRYWAPRAPGAGDVGQAPIRFEERGLRCTACCGPRWRSASSPTCRSGRSSRAASTPRPWWRSCLNSADAGSRPSPSGSRTRRASTSDPTPRQVSQLFGSEHTEFVVNHDKAELIERLVWHHDQPLRDSSALPTFLLSDLTGRHVKVALSGDGGDELFGGYERFAAALAVNLVGRLPASLPKAARWGTERVPPHLLGGRVGSVGRMLRRVDEGLPGGGPVLAQLRPPRVAGPPAARAQPPGRGRLRPDLGRHRGRPTPRPPAAP